MATILTVLDALVQFEEALRDLYITLSDLYAQDSIASGIFYRLSLKEAAHVNLVKYNRRLAHENAGNLRHIEIDVSEIKELLTKIREFKGRADAPRLEESVDFAIELESVAGDRVHQELMAHRNPDIARMLRALANDDRKHLEILQKLKEKRQDTTRPT